MTHITWDLNLDNFRIRNSISVNFPWYVVHQYLHKEKNLGLYFIKVEEPKRSVYGNMRHETVIDGRMLRYLRAEYRENGEQMSKQGKNNINKCLDISSSKCKCNGILKTDV